VESFSYNKKRRRGSVERGPASLLLYL